MCFNCFDQHVKFQTVCHLCRKDLREFDNTLVNRLDFNLKILPIMDFTGDSEPEEVKGGEAQLPARDRINKNSGGLV